MGAITKLHLFRSCPEVATQNQPQQPATNDEPAVMNLEMKCCRALQFRGGKELFPMSGVALQSHSPDMDIATAEFRRRGWRRPMDGQVRSGTTVHVLK